MKSMTHSLHRIGSHLDQEIVFILTPSRGINAEGAEENIKKFLDIIVSHQPVHYGDDRVGNRYTAGYDEITRNLEGVTNIHAVFNNLEKAKQALKDIIKADLGLSVVISGLFETTQACCQASGIQYHSVEHSLGIWGDKALMPDDKTLEILTMCGHGLVSANLIKLMADAVRSNEKTAYEVAEEMAKLCLCGIFNTERAALMLTEIASS
jgi:hypothetical protein